MKATTITEHANLKGELTGFLTTLPLFDELKKAEIESISNHLDFIELKKDEVLFREGEKGDCVSFVVEGTLDVIKQALTGESVVITALHRGRSIGEMSIIDDFPRSATVKARTDSKLIILTREGFDLMLGEDPQLGIKILKKISRLLSLNLRKTSSRLADYMLPLT